MINRADKYQKQIEEEAKNLKQFKQVLDNYLEGKDTTIKIVTLKDFSNAMEYILNKAKTPFLGKKEKTDNIAQN